MPPPADVLVTSSRRRFPALDGLRGIAMLAVVCCHSVWPSATAHFDAFDRVTVNGWIGVDLFFVLSGFLITGILIDARGQPGYFSTFYARRALRIFPIYYLFLVALFIWIPFAAWAFVWSEPWQYTQTLSHQAWYWTYLVNVLQTRSSVTEWFSTGHLWSLSVEEQFYLVWPAALLLLPRRRLPIACIAMFVAALALRCWWVATHDHLIGAYVLTPMRMDSLAVGALIAALARTPNGTQLLRRWRRPVGLCALGVALPLQAVFGANLQSPPIAMFGYSLNAVVFASLIAWLIDRDGEVQALASKPLGAIGRVSYGGYLYHLPIIGICAPLRGALVAFAGRGAIPAFAAHIAWLATVMLLTLAVAAISYRWVETPFLELKQRIGGERSHAAALAATS